MRTGKRFGPVGGSSCFQVEVDVREVDDEELSVLAELVLGEEIAAARLRRGDDGRHPPSAP